MNDLSYTQEYYLCAINEKGKPSFSKSTEIVMCLLVGCLIELQEGGYLELEKKRYHLAEPWDHSRPYLEPVYDYISRSKRGVKLESLAERFMGGKYANSLLEAVGSSLVEFGCVEEIPAQGIFSSRSLYAPKPEYTRQVIDKVRAELLGTNAIDSNTVILGALLAKTKILGSFFSKEEAKEIKDKLEQIKSDDSFKAVKKALDYLDILFFVIIAGSMRR